MNVLFALGLLGIILTLIKRKPSIKEGLLIAASFVIFIYLTSTGGQSLNTTLFLGLLLLPVAAGVIMNLLDRSSKIDIKLALLLAVWYVGMIYASLKGVRFILLLVPAFSVALGITIGYVYQYIVRTGKENLKFKGSWVNLVAFLLLCLVLIAPVKAGLDTADNFVPSITKGLYDGLIKINQESRPNAIINSWWDFGHWFKYFADRAVTLDGATQNGPDAHWLGAVLQTPSEKEAVSILRMLDCGSNTFFEKINEKYNDTEKSQNIVSNAILMNKSDAISYLEGLGFDNAESIVAYSHCTPPEDYFVTSGDMVGKAGVWAHFGLWDFDKAWIISNVRPKSLSEGTQLLMQRFNYTQDEATRVYYEVEALSTDQDMNNWIAPWPSYAGGAVNCPNDSDVVICKFNLGISNNGQTITVIDRAIVNVSDPTSSSIVIAFYDQNGKKLQETPGSLAQLSIITNTTKIYKSSNATISLGMALSVDKQGNETTYTGLIADPLLIDSTFTKLFYFDGKNMKYFDKFYDQTDITGSRIIIWKVDWQKFLAENGG